MKIQSTRPLKIVEPSPQQTEAPAKSEGSFDSVMVEELSRNGVEVSKHAAKRIKSRQIEFSEDEAKRIGHGMQLATQKGAREALLLLQDKALIVDVRNRKVVTALDRDALKEKIVTNIDSTLLL